MPHRRGEEGLNRMSEITPLMPRQPVPELKVELADGGTWRLADQSPKTFTMIVFYRGLHCPICSRQLREVEDLLHDFEKRGVEPIAISSDPRETAEKTKVDWMLDDLKVGYGLDFATARKWGLYISEGLPKPPPSLPEPALFTEPGLFLVRPDGTLYFASVQTMPFARPSMQAVLAGIDFVMAKDYPARGEVVSWEKAQAAE
jgi:peroxiredoxin